MKAAFTIIHLAPATLVLQASGDLTTPWGASFKEQLMQLHKIAINKEGNSGMVISLKEIVTIDVSAFQLLYLFRKRMQTAGYTVSILLPDLPSLAALIEKSGWRQVLVPSEIKQLNTNY